MSYNKSKGFVWLGWTSRGTIHSCRPLLIFQGFFCLYAASKGKVPTAQHSLFRCESAISTLTEFRFGSYLHFLFRVQVLWRSQQHVASKNRLLSKDFTFQCVNHSFNFQVSRNLLKGKLRFPLITTNLTIHSEVEEIAKGHLSGQLMLFSQGNLIYNSMSLFGNILHFKHKKYSSYCRYFSICCQHFLYFSSF